MAWSRSRGRSRSHSRYESIYPEYVSVGERQAKAERKVAALKNQGRQVNPVRLEGRTIASTFWGKAWCKNLEAYAALANRLDRGRSYVRSGSVIDLQIAAGKIDALVMGTELYTVTVSIGRLDPPQWAALCQECVGRISSLIELVQGKLSKGVMEILTRPKTGMFPQPKEISYRCSCPDSASLCKHIAAVLYGIGARLDEQPELFFVLRQVDQADMVGGIGGHATQPEGATSSRRLGEESLSSLFGIELEDEPAAPAAAPAVRPAASRGRPASRGSADAPQGRWRDGATVTARELSAEGIPHAVMQRWLASGVLIHTGRRGEYRASGATAARIQEYLLTHATR